MANNIDIVIGTSGVGAAKKSMSGIEAAVNKFGKATEKASGKAGSSMKGLWKQMAVGIGVTNIVSAGIRKINTIINDTISSTTEFQKEFANVTTLMNSAADSPAILNIREDILSLAGPLGSATELTKGLYQAISASVKPAKSVKFVAESAKFAQGALASMSDSVDVLTTVINAYGLAAEDVTDVSDVLFEVIKQGKINGQELASTLGTVIPSAATLGINLREVGAAAAVMTQGGIDAATTMTSLNAVMMAILKPSKDAEKVAKEFGIELSKIGVERAGGLQKWLEDVKNKIGNNEKAMARLTPNIRALRATFTLTGKGAEKYAKILKDMNDKTIIAGNTQRAFEKQQRTFGATMTAIKNKVEAVFIKTLLPSLQSLAKYLKANSDNIVNFFKAGIENAKNIIKFFIKWKDVIITVGKAWLYYFAVKKINVFFTAMKVGFTGVISRFKDMSVYYKVLKIENTGALRSFKSFGGAATTAFAGIGKAIKSVLPVMIALFAVERIINWINTAKKAEKEMIELRNKNAETVRKWNLEEGKIIEIRAKAAEKARLLIKKQIEEQKKGGGVVIDIEKGTSSAYTRTMNAQIRARNEMLQTQALRIKYTEQFVKQELAKQKQIEENAAKQKQIDEEREKRIKSESKRVEKGIGRLKDFWAALTRGKEIEAREKKIKKLTKEKKIREEVNKLFNKELTFEEKVQKAFEKEKKIREERIKKIQEERKAIELLNKKRFSEFVSDVAARQLEDIHPKQVKVNKEIEKNIIAKALATKKTKDLAAAEEKEAKQKAKLIKKYEESKVKIEKATNSIYGMIDGLTNLGFFSSKMGENFKDAAGGVADVLISLKKPIDETFTKFDKFSAVAGGVATALGSIIGASDKTKQALQGIATGVSNAFEGFATGNVIQGITGVGTALMGVVSSLFKSNKGIDKAIKRENAWMELTEEQTEKLKELAKEMGNTHAATSVMLDELMDGNVTLENSDKWLGRIRETLSDVDRGTISAKDSVDAMNKSFKKWIEQAQKLGTTGGKKFFEFIDDLKNRGLEVEEVNNFVIESFMKGLEGYKKLQQAMSGDKEIKENMEGLNKELEELKKKLKGAKKGSEEYNETAKKISEVTQEMAKLEEKIGRVTAVQEIFGNLNIDVYDDIIAMEKRVADNPVLFQAIEGMNESIINFSNSTKLTQDQFDDFGSSAQKVFSEMTERGFTSEEALASMAPTLKRLEFLQGEFGYSVDDGTEKLIKQAKELGLLDKQDPFDKMANNIGEMTGVMKEFIGLFSEKLGIVTKDAADDIAKIGREVGGLERRIKEFDAKLDVGGGKIPGFASGTGSKMITAPGLFTLGELGPERVDFSGKRMRVTPTSSMSTTNNRQIINIDYKPNIVLPVSSLNENMSKEDIRKVIEDALYNGSGKLIEKIEKQLKNRAA